MTTEEFETLVAGAMKKMPKEFRERLDNILVIVKARPTMAQGRRFGPGLLGLYEGIPLSERGSHYSGAMPDKITLFKDNLETAGRNKKEVAAAIRHTLMHELAHYFGMDDEELIEKGLY